MEKILKELMEQKGDPCVSMIISTEMKSFADKEKIRIKFKNKIKLAARMLQVNGDKETPEKLIQSIKSLIKKIDMDSLLNGIGIYVSQSFEKVVLFPFPVKDKVTITDSFEVMAVRESLAKMIRYTVVVLNKNKVRVFIGKGKTLQEVNDEHFPLEFKDEFQVHRASTHSLYNNEESKIDRERIQSYFRKIDNLLGDYVKEDPIVILGVTKYLSDFRLVTKHGKLIIFELTGSFGKYTLYEITQLVWTEVENYLRKEKQLDSSHL